MGFWQHHYKISARSGFFKISVSLWFLSNCNCHLCQWSPAAKKKIWWYDCQQKTLSVPPAIILERGGVVSCLLLSGIFLICCCCGYPLFIFSRITGWALKTPANKVDIFMEASLLNKRWIAGLCNSSWPEPGKRRGGKGGREGGTDGWWTDGWPNIWIDRWKDGWMDGWLLWMCVFLSRLPSKKTVNTSLLCLTPVHLSDVFLYPTVRPFDTLFISVSLSLSVSHLFMSPSPSLLSTLSHFLFTLSDLLFTSPRRLFLSFPWHLKSLRPLQGVQTSNQKCFPLRKRNAMMNKRTEQRDR